ncbi:hypothetical protein BH09BAC1_BH09BAC1_05100 [soil metagenome]
MMSKPRLLFLGNSHLDFKNDIKKCWAPIKNAKTICVKFAKRNV